jgi:hypothetical protein
VLWLRHYETILNYDVRIKHHVSGHLVFDAELPN